MALSISGGSGSITSQANTQTPQTSVGPASNAAPAGRVQQGTASSLLTTSNGGISLTPHALPTVTVSATTTTTAQSSQPEPAPAKHHLNPLLLGLAILLFVIAAIAFVLISRSAKNTTR